MTENGKDAIVTGKILSTPTDVKRKKRQQQKDSVSTRTGLHSSSKQKLVAFGRCYNYAIPETTMLNAIHLVSRESNSSSDNVQQYEVNDNNDVSDLPGWSGSQESLVLSCNIPMTTWDNDVPPWASKCYTSSDDTTTLVKQIASSFQSTLYLTSSGRVYQQGLLHGYCMPNPTRIDIPLPLKCIQITAGRHFCLALLENGVAVVSWGAGHFGQLGIGANYGSHSPGTNSRSDDNYSEPITFTSTPCIIERLLPNSNDSPVVSIVAGDWHALALTQSGRVWAWGCNRNLQCGRKFKSSSTAANGSSPSNSSSVPSSPAPTITVPLPVPLRSSTVSTGHTNSNSNKSSFHVTHIAAGRSHSMILARESFLKTVATNKPTANPIGNTSDTGPETITSPTTRTVTRSVVYCWGNSHHGQCGNTVTRRSVPGVLPQAVESLRDVDICQISAGGNHSMALTAQGRILCWGSHIDGQLGIGVASIPESSYMAFMESQEDTTTSNNGSNPTIPATSAVQCKPRLVTDLDFVAIAAGQEWTKQQQQPLLLSLSNSSSGSVQPGGLLSEIPRIRSIHAGPTYSAAINSLGQLYVWGSNDAGQLGIAVPAQGTIPYLHEDNNALRVVVAEEENQNSMESKGEGGVTTISHSFPRQPHSQTFDSRHNILLPTRVDVIRNVDVQDISCGPNHMWCIGRERALADMDEYNKVCVRGKTLYEIQEGRKTPSSMMHRKLGATASSTKPLEPPGLYDETKGEVTRMPQKETSPSQDALDGTVESRFMPPPWATSSTTTLYNGDGAAARLLVDSTRNPVSVATSSSATTPSTDATSSGLRTVASTGTAASGVAAAQACSTIDAEEVTETEVNDFGYDDEDDTVSRWSQSMTSMASNSFHHSPLKQSSRPSFSTSSIQHFASNSSQQQTSSLPIIGEQKHHSDIEKITESQHRGRHPVRGTTRLIENKIPGQAKARGRRFSIKKISDRLMRRNNNNNVATLEDSDVANGVRDEDSSSKSVNGAKEGCESELAVEQIEVFLRDSCSDEVVISPPNQIAIVSSSGADKVKTPKRKSKMLTGVFGGLRRKDS